MRHWTMRQFNAMYLELSIRSVDARGLYLRESGTRAVEALRTVAALELMMADLFEAASSSDAIGTSLFEGVAYARAADQRRTIAKGWRELADLKAVA